MSIYWVRVDGGQYNVVGDKMFLDGDYLYIYKGEELRAMFRTDIVLEARLAKEAVN
jgi:hypothetical protein